MRDFLYKLVFVIRAYLYALKRGTAKGQLTNPKNIVVIQPAQLGDMVCTTPMFRAIKRLYPDCQVTVVGKAVGREVLEGNPDVDDYIVWSEDIGAMAALLKEKKFDFGCVTSPGFHALAALFLGNVRVVAAPTVINGWTPYETRPYKLLRPLVLIKTHRMRSYAPGEYLKLLEPLGIHTKDTTKYVHATDAGKQKATAIIASIPRPYGFLVGIVTGAGNKIKQWPPERFAKVADYLIEKHNAHIIVIGGKDNSMESQTMIAAVAHKGHVTDTTAVLSLDELKALVARLDMLVSVDTGPVFFAEAQGVPTVDIAGNIDENEQAPNDGKNHLVVVPKDRKGPVVMTMNAHVIDFDEALKQINSVTVEQVIEVLEVLLGTIKTHARNHS
jgi:ADP-heptose:LPS heptosyltransferase